MGLKWYQIFGWEIIAKVRRAFTSRASCSLNMKDVFNLNSAGHQTYVRHKTEMWEFEIVAIVADLAANLMLVDIF